MVGFHPDATESLGYLHSALSKLLALGDPVDFPHESPRVIAECIISFLELVEFLHHGDRDYQVIFLEFLYRLVVMEDDIGIKDEYLRVCPAAIFFGHVSVFGHMVLMES